MLHVLGFCLKSKFIGCKPLIANSHGMKVIQKDFAEIVLANFELTALMLNKTQARL
jgi:hypothetical protein